MSLLEQPPPDQAVIDPADIDLPATQPIDITSILKPIAARG